MLLLPFGFLSTATPIPGDTQLDTLAIQLISFYDEPEEIQLDTVAIQLIAFE